MFLKTGLLQISTQLKNWRINVGEMADYYIDIHLDAYPDDVFFSRRNSVKPSKNSTPYWKTKDGRLLDINTMEQSHMINCVKMCLRSCKQPPARMLERLKEAGITFDAITTGD